MSNNGELNHAILEQLGFGLENAITKTNLMSRLGLKDDRLMREEIKALRHAGYLIGLSVKKPYGYYMINTVRELTECMGTMKGYCVNAAIARRALKIAGRVLLHPGQLPLGL